MNIIRYLHAAFICCGAISLGFGIGDTPLVAQDNGNQSIPNSSSNVIPLPEAEQQYSSVTPVDTIIVDKHGTMSEGQYNYDPDQGGVVINNYDEVAGSNASVFFPAFEVGLLWWGGYWVDHDGNYWDGNHYTYINDPHWHDHWDHYWNRDWNNKWNQYRQQHPNAQSRYRQNGGNFQHHNNGMNRAGQPGRGGGGPRGGGRR